MKITIQPNLGQTQDATISPIVRSLVRMLREVSQAVGGNLTFGDNVVGQFNKITINTLPSYGQATGTVFQPIILPWNYKGNYTPNSVLVGQIVQPSSQSTRLLHGQTVQWTYDSINGTINISYITGLLPSSQFFLTLEIK